MMTKKKISRIGLGCVTFGREIDLNASFAMMDHAVANGITLFDTAAVYSAGISEQIVGAWLSARQPEAGSILIATKVLPPYDGEHLAESVNASLRRLGTDSIDILYLHRWDASIENGEALAALNNLVRSGKVHMPGVSNFSEEQLGQAIRLQKTYHAGPFCFAQNNHNLAVSDLNQGFRQICAEHAIDIITYSPLGAGFLTGKHQSGVLPGSRFDLVQGHQAIYFNEAAYRRLERLKAVAVRTGYAPAHLALAWALHQNTNSVLVGGRTPGQLDQAFAALLFDEPEIFAELEAV